MAKNQLTKILSYFATFYVLTIIVHDAGSAEPIDFEENFQNSMKNFEEINSELLNLNNKLTEVIQEDENTSKDRHPCQRTCEDGKPMTCRYQFDIEYYYTMSKACFDCPFNTSHCSLPHCIQGDGVKRTVLAVNRQIPGPAIEVCYGDTIEVDVRNKMLDISTTIHWHGLFQKETPFMDGVPFVAQCMISPQSEFFYRFYADNPGTHFWHSHSALQRGDGIFGPLIIRVPQSNDPFFDLYDFDLTEHVVMMIDWEHQLSVDKFMKHYLSNKGDNKPQNILVNGKGRYQEFVEGDNVIYTPAETFTVEKGFRYKFRIINAGFLNCPIEFSVDNHNMTVIASDGGNLEPIVTDRLTTVAGERFDVIIEANQEIGNYWMRFKGILDCSVKKAYQVAILRYKGANEEDPEGEVSYETAGGKGLNVNAVNTPPGTKDTLIMSELSALTNAEDDPVLKLEPDVKFYIPYDFYPVENFHYQPVLFSELKKKKTTTPQINHISMQFPDFPLMANLDRAGSIPTCNATSVSLECRNEFCECPHVLEVPLNAVVEFILIDEGKPFDSNHPFHLHGFTFKILGMDRLGSSTTEEEVRRLDEEGLLKRNLVNPPVKDTVTVPDGGYAILRFHATNPGYWILHCHLDFHVELGMALLFKVGDHAVFKQAPENFPMCGNPFQVHPVNQSVFAQFFPSAPVSTYGKGTFYKIEESNVLSNADTLVPSCNPFKMLLMSFCVLTFFVKNL